MSLPNCSLCGKPDADNAHHEYGLVCDECRLKLVPVCDFCCSPEIYWSFPCRSFELETPAVVGDETFHNNSVSGWAACNECHELIEDGAWITLAKRSMEMHPKPPPPEIRERVFHELLNMHQMFNKNRLGPAKPVNPGERDE